MLSSSPIKNASQASHYYSQKDNYYTRDEGLQQSEWWGKGAEKLQLSGQVDEKQFTELLEGKLPNGERLGIVIDGELKHRAGWDLTFSAPKSASVMAYIGGDTRLLKAQLESVYVTLSYIERSCAQVRVKKDGKIVYQNTGNLVAALVPHDLSRELDPQIHIHALIMNMTERADQLWRSLASQSGRYDEKTIAEVNGFIERVRHNNRFFAKIYETELAYRVKQLGYEITTDTPSGKFEIVGVSPEVIQFFSKRRNQIEKELKENGFSGGKAAEIATLSTRQNKTLVNRDELNKQWVQEAKELGLDCEKILQNTYQKAKMTEDQHKIHSDHPVFNVLEKSAKALSVFQTTFLLDELMLEAADYAIHETIAVDTLLKGIDAQVANGDLIPIEGGQGKSLFIAKSTLEDEKRISEHLQNNLHPAPTVKASHIDQYLTQHNEIPAEYHGKLQAILDHDRVILIEGKTAKEALIEPVMKIAKSADCEVMILSPTLVGSKQFAKDVSTAQTFWEHIKSFFVDLTPKHESVMQFLSRFNEESRLPKIKPDILIVDNAHLLSTHQKANLIEWNSKHHSKLILLGNKETLLPQQRGTSIEKLIEEGVKSISLPSKDHTIHPDSIPVLINKVADRIMEVTHQEDRYHAMAAHFIRLSDSERKQSWLLAHTKQSVEELNCLTHQKMVEENKVKAITKFNVLIPVFLTEVKAQLASTYQKNQIVRFNEAYKSLDIERGEYLKVIHTNEKSNRVILGKTNGQEIVWHPERIGGKSGKIEFFNEKEREMGIGESVIFHRSIKSKQIVKGERLTIENLYKQQMTLRNNEGKKITIDISKSYHRHMDYGYAATPHTIAHEKPTTLIADLPAQSFLTDQRRFQQILSQPKEAWIYTEDSQQLAMKLEKNAGNRLTAYETLKQSEDLKKSLHAIFGIIETKIIEKEGDTNIDAVKKAVNAMDYAMRHLAEREAGFTHKDLMQVAMKHALGQVNVKQLTTVALQMEKTGILVRGRKNDETLWTTIDAVKIEREILAFAIKDQGKFEPIASDEVLSRYCDPTKLRPEQIIAIKTITQNKDRVLSIQGRAGTGKTTMMLSLQDVLSAKDLLTENGYRLQGIAPTHKGVKELRARGITAQTVDSFLLDMQKILDCKVQHDFSKTVLVVDEASMVSNRKMRDVLKISHDFNFRGMLPTGDKEQNPAIEAGKPHDLIQRSLETTILLKDIQRQKNLILKEAVQAIYKGNVSKTFSILNKSIIEINEKGAKDPKDVQLNSSELYEKYYAKRVEAIVKDYISLLKKGENVQIIAPSHKDRKAVNEEVRLQLDQLGMLKGEDHSFSILTSKDMTGVERTEAMNFKLGQVLRFNMSSGKLIKSGDYLTIKSINKSHNILTLIKNDKEILWQVPHSQNRINNMVEVFAREERCLKVGDKITWIRSDKKEGNLSTDFAEVTGINQQDVTVKRPDNTSFTFNGSDEKYRHWDHGYAITVYGAQGGTYSTVLALFETVHKKLMNFKNFLVTITRPENNLRIYTNDKDKLMSAIASNKGDKVSSLEVIGEYPQKQKEKSTHNTKEETKTHHQEKRFKNHAEKEQAPSRFDKHTIERIKEGLNQDVENIAISILGEPKMRGSNFLKFGSHKGSLSVTIKGEMQGWWNDFSEKGGRGMLSFIQKHLGLNRSEALKYGAQYLNIYPAIDTKEKQEKIKKAPEKNQKYIDKNVRLDNKKRIDFAKKLAEQSQSIKGTLVERYLKEHRAIAMETFPSDIRFHPGIYSKLNGKTHPAMLVIARDKSGKIQAVQATYLDKDTAGKVDATRIQKQTFGLLQGATVSIHGKKEAPTLVAEGVETGLSLAGAIQNVNIKITLGKSNFKHINPNTVSEKIIFCLDNDGKDIKADKIINDSANRLIESNKRVAFMFPTCLKNQKQDYNDIQRELGTEAIKKDFEQVVSYAEWYGKNQVKSIEHFDLPHPDVIKEVINQDRNLDKIANNHISNHQDSQKISDAIKNFAQAEMQNIQRNEVKNVEAYKSISQPTPSHEVSKTIQRVKELEHEI